MNSPCDRSDEDNPVMSTQPETAQAATARVPAPSGVLALEARHLTKHFAVRSAGGALRRRRHLHAVDDVSLGLARGAVTSVVGESGSGKSVLARMLARIIAPSAGELLLDGEPLALGQRRRHEYAAAVQLVLQDPFASMNPVHRVSHHLARPLLIHGTPRSDLDSAMKALLRRVALDPPEQFMDKFPHELSGGQLQRVSIARALAVRPGVLLADEPVSMLDVSIRLGVLNLLAELREQERLAILYITHDIASARYLADDILVMYAGEVVERAPSISLTDSPAHPYTQLLLSAAPDPGRRVSTTPADRGAPPRLIDPGPGCRFQPRCPHAMEICRRESPPVFDVAEGHQVACWLQAPASERRGLLTTKSQHAALRRLEPIRDKGVKEAKPP
jgi:peptide/nickel transport system ATP-binding protein